MDHFDDILILLVLNLEVWSFNISYVLHRMIGVDNINTGFVVFVSIGQTSRWKAKTGKYMTEEKAHFCS